MRIAVMAAGAVGGYFGARLAVAGHDVQFIARGSNLQAIRANGLKIKSVLGDVHVQNPSVTDDTTKVGPVDIVLFAVKPWDTETAARQTLPLVGKNTRVISLQNGIDSGDVLHWILGTDVAVPGCAYIAASNVVPGRGGPYKQDGAHHCGPCRRPARCADRSVHRGGPGKQAGRRFAVQSRSSVSAGRNSFSLWALPGATASTRLPLGPIPARTLTLAHPFMG